MNYENLTGLIETRASVSAQTAIAHLEHVVIDAASTDGAAEWISSLPQDHSLKWISEPDCGIYDGMNKGARLAGGRYLLFLNSGDVLHDSHVVAKLLDAVRERPHWLVGRSLMSKGLRTRRRIHSAVPFRQVLFTMGLRSIPHQATAISRESFWQLGGYDLTWGTAADQELNYRLLKHKGAPAEISVLVATCDSNGVSSKVSPSQFVEVMRSIRANDQGPLARNASRAVAPILRWALDVYVALRSPR